MAQPQEYNPSSDFSDTGSVDLSKLDTEFLNISETLTQVINNLKLIQRDDTKIANAAVHPASLSAETLLALSGSQWNFKGDYATGVNYVLGDLFVHTINSVKTLYWVTQPFTASDFSSESNFRVNVSGYEALIDGLDALVDPIINREIYEKEGYGATRAAAVAYYAGLSQSFPVGKIVIETDGLPYRFVSGGDASVTAIGDSGANWVPVLPQDHISLSDLTALGGVIGNYSSVVAHYGGGTSVPANTKVFGDTDGKAYKLIGFGDVPPEQDDGANWELQEEEETNTDATTFTELATPVLEISDSTLTNEVYEIGTLNSVPANSLARIRVDAYRGGPVDDEFYISVCPTSYGVWAESQISRGINASAYGYPSSQVSPEREIFEMSVKTDANQQIKYALGVITGAASSSISITVLGYQS